MVGNINKWTAYTYAYTLASPVAFQDSLELLVFNP